MKTLNHVTGFIVLMCLLLSQSVVYAQVYKYKDKNGRWQFSDRQPKSSDAVSLEQYKTTRLSGAVNHDFVTLLTKKYSPKSDIQRATLAVAQVKSQLGSGSAFFVSDDCYLITNKHVIRPAEGKAWDKTQQKIKKNESSFKASRQQINDEKERLKINKERLDEYRQYIDKLIPGANKRIEEKEYALLAKRYKHEKEKYDEVSKTFAEQERVFKKQQSDFNFSSSLANTAQSFEIILKDNTKTQANLIKVSESADLALLKINACKSPHLKFARSGNVSQGVAVYAIGSPLGLRDQLTKGTITRVSHSGVYTDAQILPGNSGGPLVTQEGEVVGVNTLKVSQSTALGEGFGIAIPVREIKANFGSYLK